MQKKIIALAVAGLVSGVAFAQTNVTVYGAVDAAYTYSKQGDAKFSGIESGGWNGGRVGFRGEEALGNGLKAIFTYEFGTDADVSSGLSGTRLSFVGLSGNFGSVTAGRQGAPSYVFLGSTSSNDITTVYPTNLMLGSTDAFSTMSTGGSARWDNSIAYQSPNWSGFDLRAVYSFGENVRDSFSDASTDASKAGIGVRYANGPVYLTAIYQTVLDNNGTTPAGVDVDVPGSKSWAIGGSYDFKVVKLYANYIQEKWDNGGPLANYGIATDGDAKHKLWSVGLSVPVGQAGTVRAEYMQIKADELDSGKAKGFGIGYDYDLSKRTKIYTAVSRINNDDGMAWGYSKVRGSGKAAVGTTPASSSYLVGEDSTNFQVGIRHFF